MLQELWGGATLSAVNQAIVFLVLGGLAGPILVVRKNSVRRARRSPVRRRPAPRRGARGRRSGCCPRRRAGDDQDRGDHPPRRREPLASRGPAGSPGDGTRTRTAMAH